MSSEAVKERAAALRHHLGDESLMASRWALAAATWEALRLRIDKGDGTLSDDSRYSELTTVLRALSKRLGITGCTEQHKGTEGVPGITLPSGLLPGPDRIISSDWREVAEMWAC